MSISNNNKSLDKCILREVCSSAETCVYTGDVFWGSNLENRDGLEAMTGVPGHARASQLVSKNVLSLFLIHFETDSKLNIYPYLFNHHYGFQQP